MHQTLYRKYRPSNFDEVAGGADIIKTIKNSLRQDMMSHAYLFTGPRGIGKTTTARLIAKGLNCMTNGVTDNPCGVCENCVAISNGTFIDMIEIDAASNRGIDEIRGLKDKINYQPVKGRKKVYIIDEVHMLTREAFNAILKTLEEPPSHVIFILATTEPEKILSTIISRCQRYDFKLMSFNEAKVRLEKIIKAEGIVVDDGTLRLIYEKSGGSMRDAISILEKVMSSCYEEEISLEKSEAILGVVPKKLMEEFYEILEENRLDDGMAFLDRLWDESINVEVFFKDFAGDVRTRMLKGKIDVEVGLKLIEDIFDTITKFKQEEDKRLLGYVILSKNKVANRKSLVREVVKEVVYKESTETPQGTPEIPVETKEVIDLNIGVEDIKRVWDEVVIHARKSKITLGAFLVGAYPTRVEGNIITIGFSAENSFSKEMMEEKQHNAYLEQALKEVVHPQVKVKYEVVGALRQEHREENISFADKIVEFFDGELI